MILMADHLVNWLVVIILCQCTPRFCKGNSDKKFQGICPDKNFIDSEKRICQKQCSDGYFTNHGSKVCEKCEQNCETCHFNKTACTSCAKKRILKDISCISFDECRGGLIQHKNDNSIRLVNGSNSLEGRVEIKINNVWGTICDDLWTRENGNVICRMLKMGHAVEIFPSAHFGMAAATVPVLVDDLRCVGTEKNIDYCTHGGYGVHDCSHREDASVKCSGPNHEKACVTSCDDGYFRDGIICSQCNANCASCMHSADKCTKCHPGWYLQDERCVSNCSTGRYEHRGRGICKKCEDPFCLICDQEETKNGCKLCTGLTVLVDGKCQSSCPENKVLQSSQYITLSSSTYIRGIDKGSSALTLQGTVELHTTQRGMPICDDSWDIKDAQVVCRQLGLGLALLATSNDNVTDTVFEWPRNNLLTKFNCKGDEMTLLDCEHEILKGGCRGSRPAGVTCVIRELETVTKMFECLHTCKRGFYSHHGSCLLCSFECLECKGRYDRCTACKEPFFLSKSKCVLHCGIFEYGDTRTRVCMPCDRDKCGTCQDGHRNDSCLSCDEPLFLSNSQCVKNCSQNLVGKDGECVHNCSIGYYRSSTKCQRCPQDCYGCKRTNGSRIVCIACKPPKVLALDGECRTSCPFPSLEITDSSLHERMGLGVKLVGEGSIRQVLIKKNNMWFPVCGSRQNENEKIVICRELNLGAPVKSFTESSDDLTWSGYIHGLQCVGTEKTVSECNQGEVTNSICGSTILSVGCTGKSAMCIKRCPYGYTTDIGSRKCVKCGSFCTECHKTPYFCTGCKKGRVFHQNSCLLQCPEGYFEDMKTRRCISCSNNCLSCDESNPKHCRSCKKPYFLKNRACFIGCNDSYQVSHAPHLKVLMTNSGSSEIQFHLQLNETGKSGTICTEDHSSWNEEDFSVVCRELHYGAAIPEASFPHPFYTNEPVWIKNGHCNGNESSILDCGSFEYKSGATCSKVTFYCTGPDLSRVCLKHCPEGYLRKTGGICQQCHPSCQNCKGTEYDCTRCSFGYYRTPGGACRRECPTGYFGNISRMCENCSPSCLECSQTASLCTKCKKSFFLQGNNCVQKCSSGVFTKGSPSLTLTRFQDKDVAFLRPSETREFMPLCFNPISKTTKRVICRSLGFSNVVPVTSIPRNEDILLPCWHVSEISCSGFEVDLHNCSNYATVKVDQSFKILNLKCSGGALIDRCIESCPEGATLVNNTCMRCAPFCKTCTGKPDSCQSCRTPLFLENNICRKKCQHGFFGNIKTRKCQRCDATCLTCVNGISNDYCTSCAEGLLLFKDKCISKRPPNTVLAWDVVRQYFSYPKVRLVDSVTGASNEGILQLLVDGVWRSTCSKMYEYLYNFGKQACLELGFKDMTITRQAKEIYRLNRTAASLSTESLDLTYCAGQFDRISSCRTKFRLVVCSHSKDIYVKCSSSRAAREHYDYYQELNGRSCATFPCMKWITCLDVVTQSARNDSICINCPTTTIMAGSYCRVVINEVWSLKEPLSSRAVNEGDLVTLACPIQSQAKFSLKDEVPSVLWFRNGELLGTNFRDVLKYLINGYGIRFKASFDTNGHYTCRISTTGGDIQSSMYLTVIGKPTISRAYTTTKANPDQPCVLMCESQGNITWQWYFKGEKLKGDRFEFSKLGQLVIKKFQVTDIGLYSCVAKNSAGSARAFIEIETPVTIKSISIPADVIVNEGGTAVINCTVVASGPVKIAWKMWGKELPLNQKYSISRKNRGILTVTDVGVAEQAIYTCIAISDSMVESKNVNLLMKGSPYIYEPPKNVHAIKGAVVTLECLVLGVPPLQYTWLKNRDVIRKGDTRAHISNDGTILKLFHVNSDQSAVYTCRFTNPFGFDQRAAEVTVLDIDLKKEKGNKGKPDGYMLPSFGDSIFKVVFGPIIAIVVIGVIICCICRYQRKRQKMKQYDTSSIPQHNGSGQTFAVKYHIPSRALDIVEEEQKEDEEYDATLEMIRYDDSCDPEIARLVVNSDKA